MSEESSIFSGLKVILAVIASIVIIILLVAPELIGAGGEDAQPLDVAVVEENIKPIGQVATSKAEAQKATPKQEEPVVEVATGPLTGKQVFDQACFACHATGVAGAPKVGDAAAWSPRVAQGASVLLDHAINGFKGMPARGGFALLTDDNVQVAIDYMVGSSK